jgi:hypothetical protein
VPETSARLKEREREREREAVELVATRSAAGDAASV